MDSEAKTIWHELPPKPKGRGWSGWFDPKIEGEVFASERDGKPFVEIYLKTGGWLGFYLDDAMADLGPFAG